MRKEILKRRIKLRRKPYVIECRIDAETFKRIAEKERNKNG